MVKNYVLQPFVCHIFCTLIYPFIIFRIFLNKHSLYARGGRPGVFHFTFFLYIYHILLHIQTKAKFKNKMLELGKDSQLNTLGIKLICDLQEFNFETAF